MSVLYGADAIGGVVNLISSDIPIGADNIISDANLGLSYQTNNSQKDYNHHNYICRMAVLIKF